MTKGVVSDKRKRQARVHASKPHTCEICGAVKYGNGFYNHYRVCILRLHPDLAWMSGRYLRIEYYKRTGQWRGR